MIICTYYNTIIFTFRAASVDSCKYRFFTAVIMHTVHQRFEENCKKDARVISALLLLFFPPVVPSKGARFQVDTRGCDILFPAGKII